MVLRHRPSLARGSDLEFVCLIATHEGFGPSSHLAEAGTQEFTVHEAVFIFNVAV